MDSEQKKKRALWRLGVLGPLVTASRCYEDADGRRIEVKAKTIEEWYYRFLHGGFEALEPRDRSDAGQSRAIDPETAARILAAKRENPRRSIRRLIRMLERAGEVRLGELKKSTVHRLLRAHGLSGRPRREANERRAFRHALAGDLWMGDVMHGPVVIAPDQRRRKSIDSAVRFVPGCAFRLRLVEAQRSSVVVAFGRVSPAHP